LSRKNRQGLYIIWFSINLVPILQVFLDRPDVLEAMDSVMHDRKGQSVVVMTMHVNSGVPSREILTFSQSEMETNKVIKN
jgi:hypothetical protein